MQVVIKTSKDRSLSSLTSTSNTALTTYSQSTKAGRVENGEKARWSFSDDVLPEAGIFDLSVKVGGEVVSSPIEEGSFTTYNKTIEPMEVEATLAFSGTETFLQSTLQKLKTLQESVAVFSIKTPIYEFQNVTLQSYDFSMKREEGRGVLYVTATFIEIREVKQAYVTGSPITQSQTGDASATSCADNGVVQPVEYSDGGTSSTGSGANSGTSSSEYQAGQATRTSLIEDLTGASGWLGGDNTEVD